MSWDKDVPAAGIQARYLDDAVRTNNAAIDVVIGDLLDAATAITATAAELNIMDGVTASTAELNILDGVTATAAELNILDGVTASAAELNQCDDKTLLNTTDTQNFAAKTSTDGFRVTGGDLTVRPASGTVARVLAGTAAETALTLTAGGYTSQNDSAMVVVYSSDDATYPGIVALIGSNGTTGATGLTVSATGVVNIPVSLQIGGVAVSAVTSANAVSSGAKSLSSDTAIVSLASQTLVSGDYFDIVVEVTGQKQTSAGDVVLYLVTNNTIVSNVVQRFESHVTVHWDIWWRDIPVLLRHRALCCHWQRQCDDQFARVRQHRW